MFSPSPSRLCLLQDKEIARAERAPPTIVSMRKALSIWQWGVPLQNELDKQCVAMSDHPSELEFKLNNVVLAVSDVAEWFDLGLQLGLPSTTLRLIAADPNIKDIKSQRLAMLSEWLKYDTAASWEKLAAALATIGENVVADNVKRQFVKISTAVIDDVERNYEDSDEIGK